MLSLVRYIIFSRMSNKLYLFILLLAFGVCSCDKLSQKNEDAQLAKIEQAKIDAIESINVARHNAIENASEAINQKITSVLEGATDDISTELKSAKEAISIEVQASTQKINENVKQLDTRISNATFIGLGALVLSILALVIAVFFSRKSTHRIEDIIEEKQATLKKRIEIEIPQIVNEEMMKILRNHNSVSSKMSMPSADIEKVIASPEYIGLITQRVMERLPEDLSASASKTNGDVGKANTKASDGLTTTPKNTKPVVPVVELYARDSRSDDLPEVTANYLIGKTVYRLILSSPDAGVAEIDLCVDKEDAKRRIVLLGEELLSPICRVTRNVTNPTDVTVKERGKAERIENGGWRVVKNIVVDFN